METNQRIYEKIGKDFYNRRYDGTPILIATEPWAEPNCCHKNVEKWISEHPEDKPVRGALVENIFGYVWYFNAHSVIEKPGGNLLDITPRDQYPPFLRFIGSDADFDWFKKVGRIIYPYPSVISNAARAENLDGGTGFR